jgi:hypothetical protein
LTIFTWGITLIPIGVLTTTAPFSIHTIILRTILHRTGVTITGMLDLAPGMILTGIIVIAVIILRMQVTTAVAADITA